MNDYYSQNNDNKAGKCPKCGNSTFSHRIKRHTWMKLFFGWLALKRYICYKCNRKFYAY